MHVFLSIIINISSGIFYMYTQSTISISINQFLTSNYINFLMFKNLIWNGPFNNILNVNIIARKVHWVISSNSIILFQFYAAVKFWKFYSLERLKNVLF